MAVSSTRPRLAAFILRLTDIKLFPFYSLCVIHFLAQPPDFQEEIHTLTAIVRKIAPIWYLIMYINTLNPPQETSRKIDENPKKLLENSSSNTKETPKKIQEKSKNPEKNVKKLQKNSEKSFGNSETLQKNSRKSVENSRSPEKKDDDYQADSEADGAKLKRHYRYFFTAGLVLSSIGDAYMNTPVTFIHAMGTFGPAHSMYAMGLRTRFTSTRYAWIVYPISCLSFLTIAPGMESNALMCIVFCYNMVITVMLYHALASVESNRSSLSAWFAAVGAVSFVVSDMIIGVNKWSISVPYPNASIMATYYFAQLALALSVY